ncbi:MAG TPA: hypothetical protein VHY08_03455 [Bacillota bacterium]|nr:hypothetical protein [Bacillota bacterium]
MKESDYPGELLFFSAIAGAVAALGKSLVHHSFEWLKITINFYADVTAYLIHGHHQIRNFGEWVFAAFSDMVLGALFGMLLGFWLKSSRSKYHWWIGGGYGFGIWFASLSLGNLTKVITDTMTTPKSLLAHLVAMICFGLLFVLACRFWKPLRSRIEMGDKHGSR